MVSLSGDPVLLGPHLLHGPGAALHGRDLVPLRAGMFLILIIHFRLIKYTAAR